MAVSARWKLLVALWTVYLVWGSTYLAIKISVRTLPAFLSAGTRFLLAGGLLALILLVRGRSIRVTGRELGASAVVGTALLALGVGVVTLAETRIDSSTAAMIAGSVPLQVILLRTLARESVALATRLSVLAGLGGLALVVVPGGEGASSAVGLAIMLAASVAWSLGSFFGHRLPVPEDGFVAATWEMLGAGVFLVLLGTATGELWTMEPAGFSAESLAALLYLAVAGTLVAFTAYVWLLRNAPISKVVTHQYVNPLVAIVLGAALLGEELTVATVAGAALIVGSVFVAVRREGRLEPEPLGGRPSSGIASQGAAKSTYARHAGRTPGSRSKAPMRMPLTSGSAASSLQSAEPHSRQKTFAKPSSGRQAPSASSPWSSRNEPGATRADAAAAVPVRRWQRVQWQ
jgi:drug/metabolite transporter (DMT)-like permease